MKEKKKDPVALHLGIDFVRSVSPVALSLGACIVSHVGRSGALATSVEDGTDFRLPADEVAAPLFVGRRSVDDGTGPFLPVTPGVKAYLAYMEALKWKDPDLEGLESLESFIVDWYGSPQKSSKPPKLDFFCRSVHFDNLVSLKPGQTFSDNSLQHRVCFIEDFFACPAREVDGYQNIGSVGPVDQDTLQNIYTALHHTIVKIAGGQKHLMIALTASDCSTTDYLKNDIVQKPTWGNYDEDQMPYLKFATGKAELSGNLLEPPDIFKEEFSVVAAAFRNNGDLVKGLSAFQPVKVVSWFVDRLEPKYILPQTFDPTPHIMEKEFPNATEKKAVYVETYEPCRLLLNMTGFENILYRSLDYCEQTQKFVTVRGESLHCEECGGLQLFASCQLDKELLDKQTVPVTMVFRRPNNPNTGSTNRPGLQIAAHLPDPNAEQHVNTILHSWHYYAHRSITEASSMCGGPRRLDPHDHLCTTPRGHVWPNRPADLPPPRPRPRRPGPIDPNSVQIPRRRAVVTGMPVEKSYPILRQPMKPTIRNNWLKNPTKFIEKNSLHLRVGVTENEVYPIFASEDASNCSGMPLDGDDDVADTIIRNLKSHDSAVFCMPIPKKGSKVNLPQLTKDKSKSAQKGKNEQSVLKFPGIEPEQNDTMQRTPVAGRKKRKMKAKRQNSASGTVGKSRSPRRRPKKGSKKSTPPPTFKTHRKATDKKGRRRGRRRKNATVKTHPKTSRAGRKKESAISNK